MSSYEDSLRSVCLTMLNASTPNTARANNAVYINSQAGAELEATAIRLGLLDPSSGRFIDANSNLLPIDAAQAVAKTDAAIAAFEREDNEQR